MERHKLTADQAFQVLVQMSMKTNRKLQAIADEMVHIGEPPDRLAPRSQTGPGFLPSRPGSASIGD